MAESDTPHRGIPPSNDGLSAARVAFPQTVEDFEKDPRVAFSKLEKKYLLEDDDGSEWEFDERLKRWIPSLDEALLEQQQQAYAVPGADEAEPAVAPKKRKAEYTYGQDENGRLASTKKTKPSKPQAERKNTAVYVTSLPQDVTVDEVNQVFSRCGVIAEEIDQGRPRIKLYTDESGAFKGDALIVYFRPESVKLAIQMLDDSDFRLGQDLLTGKMRVKEADWSFKKQKEAPAEGGKAKGKGGDKQKIIKKTQKLNNKLADWDDDDPSAIRETSSRWDKVVILKHMFTLAELEEDPEAKQDIQEDIQEECSKLGEVTNVVLFDKEPAGVASVRFDSDEAARACVRLMDGRAFGGRQVEAWIADGSEKFKKKSTKRSVLDQGDDNEEEERLEKFGEWLESGGKAEVEEG